MQKPLKITIGVVLGLEGDIDDTEENRYRLREFFLKHSRTFGYIYVDSSRAQLSPEGMEMWVDLAREHGQYVHLVYGEGQLATMGEFSEAPVV